MLTPEQEWLEFARRTGFISGDIEGAKRAFFAGLMIGRGELSKPAKDIAVLDKLDEELEFIWNDDYTAHCLNLWNISDARKVEMLNRFKEQCQAKGETHGSLQLARQHFLNWVRIMKDKINGNNQQQQQRQSPDEWKDDIVGRISRLAGC